MASTSYLIDRWPITDSKKFVHLPGMNLVFHFVVGTSILVGPNSCIFFRYLNLSGNWWWKICKYLRRIWKVFDILGFTTWKKGENWSCWMHILPGKKCTRIFTENGTRTIRFFGQLAAAKKSRKNPCHVKNNFVRKSVVSRQKWLAKKCGFYESKNGYFACNKTENEINFCDITFSFSHCFRWETVSVPMGRLWMEICPVRWADPTPSEAHRGQTFQMWIVRKVLLKIRPLGAPHETTSELVGGPSSPRKQNA